MIGRRTVHYNYFRDYDPRIGRYTESDPMGLAGGISTFGYAGENPAALTDPLGLFFGIAGAGGVGGFGGIGGVGYGSGSGAGAISRGLLGLWRKFKEACQPGEDATKKSCEKANKWQLQQAGVNDEHEFKGDVTGSGRHVSQYDICACSDGTIVLRGVGQCGRAGPTIETSTRWRPQ